MPARGSRPVARRDGRDGALRRIAARRLRNLGVSAPVHATPESIVDGLGAVQSQDYAAARWALAVRTSNLTEEDVETAFDRGTILRTHVLRPTWHFVVPSSIRELLALTAPRVHASNASQYRELEIDGMVRHRTQKAMVRALRGGGQLTRPELTRLLERAGFPVDTRRVVYLAMAAELDGVICSGPRRRSEFTYALLDERAPAGPIRSTGEALEDLARRYFTSHGPATLRDFAWWSGLTVADGRRAVEMLGASVIAEAIGERTYFSAASAVIDALPAPAVHLLPGFDEFVVAYRDRDAVPYAFYGAVRPMPYLNPVIAGSQVAGTWGRVRKARAVALDIVLQRPLTRAERRSLDAAVDRLGAFAGLRVEVGVRS